MVKRSSRKTVKRVIISKPMPTMSLVSPSQSSKDVLYIRVVSTRLGDGHTQLCIAESPDGCDNSSGDPHNDGHAH